MSFCHFRVPMFLAALTIAAVAVVPAFANAPAADVTKKKEKEQPSEEAVLSANTVVHGDILGVKVARSSGSTSMRQAGIRKLKADRRLLPPRRVDQGRQGEGRLQAEVSERQRCRFHQPPTTGSRRP